MGRAPFSSEVGLERGPWTATEDALLINYIQEHGEGRWSKVPQKAGLQRCGKSCRLRWLNYLRPGLKRGNFSPDEDDLIIRLHKLLGNRWCLIAKRLPGRTDNEIKNYWNSHLSKRLLFQKISQTDQPKPSTDAKYKKKKHININPENANQKETANITNTYLPKPSRVFPFAIPITRNNSFDSMLGVSSFSSPLACVHGEGNITRSTINDTKALNSLIPPWSDLAVAAPGGDQEPILRDNECDYSCLDDLLFKEEYHNMFYKIYEEYQELLISSENHVVQADFSWVDPFLA